MSRPWSEIKSGLTDWYCAFGFPSGCYARWTDPAVGVVEIVETGPETLKDAVIKRRQQLGSWPCDKQPQDAPNPKEQPVRPVAARKNPYERKFA